MSQYDDETSDAETDRLRDQIDSLQRENRLLRERISTSERLMETTIEQALNAQRKLRRADRQAKVAERMKSEFLVNMSHELRTPMTAVLGFVELLIEGEEIEPDVRLEHLYVIKRNGEHLMRVLGDIFDLSKLESGELLVTKVSVSPFDLVNEIASQVGPLARRKGLGFDVTFLGRLPLRVETDAKVLRQTLMKLAENAVTYTEEGGVRLMVQTVSQGYQRPMLRFDLADTGLGMSPDALSRVFAAFEQGDGSQTREVGGAGLGLTIATQMASVLGGDLRAESIEGHGSVFQLTIDPGRLEGVELVDASTPEGDDLDSVETPTQFLLDNAGDISDGARILYVEDGADNRRLISFILQKVGMQVDCVENGALGVESALASIEAGHAYDLILMDMQMPVMDGYTATRQLRERAWQGPIIALTAHALQGERERALEAGCDYFVTKPVNRQELVKLVLRRLRERKPPNAG